MRELEKGTGLMDVVNMVGHEDLKMIMRYAKGLKLKGDKPADSDGRLQRRYDVPAKLLRVK